MSIKLSFLRIFALLLTGISGTASAWEPGTYPVAPARMQSSGFSVNNQNRNDVVAFWHAVYQASEGYEARISWTGDYSGNPGGTSAAFANDVERRLNYFRAMCGVPTDVHVNTGSTVLINPTDLFKPSASTLKSAACQQSALMLIRNYNSATGIDLAITHNPPSTLIGWSPAAWNASARGNFAFGLYGPGAITEYMLEALSNGSAVSSWNTDVGHRRWCLYPPATDFATGDQPGSSASRPPSNVLYVIPNASERRPIDVSPFISYPSAGFFPAPINSPFWSVSCRDADFSDATVSMTDTAGNVIPVTNIKTTIGYGDPAIVWKVSEAASVKSVLNDTTYQVIIRGIGGTDVPSSYEYAVTLINPDRLTSSQKISGSAKPVATQTTLYTLAVPEAAESIQVATYRVRTSAWKETAEKPAAAKILDDTSGSYSLMPTMSSFTGFGTVSGPKSFNLTFPSAYDLISRGVPEQSFELDRNIVAKSKATLNFLYRRGYMTTASKLVVEISSNDGVTWKTAGKPISGISNTKYDFNSTAASIPLPQSAAPIRIRFRYYTTGGAIYTHDAAPKSPTGIFLDEITSVNCDWLDKKKNNTLATTNTQFGFNSTTAGGTLAANDKWFLRLQTKLGGKWFNGPMTAVTVVAP